MLRIEMMTTHGFFGEDTHLSEEGYALFVDALRVNKVHLLAKQVLEHVDECEKCKAEILETLSLTEDESCREAEPHPYLEAIDNQTAARFSIAYRIAAIFLVGISLGVVLYLFRFVIEKASDPPNSSVSSLIGKPSIQKVPANNDESIARRVLVADNFSESPNLENLVNSVSRSESPFEVSPRNNEIVKKEILFRWKMQGVEFVTITILSNKEDVLKSSSLKRSNFLYSEKLKPGLYYWKLEHKDELLYVGKFFVK